MFSLNLIMSKHKDQSTLREILQSNWPWLLKKCLCNERQAKQKCKGHYKIKGNLKVITNAICYNSSMWQPIKLEKCVWIVYLCQLPNYCLLALTALLTLIWDTGAGSCAWTVNSFLLPAGVKWGFISRGLRGAYKQRGFPALFWFWLISPSSCTTGVSWSARNLQPSARFYPETLFTLQSTYTKVLCFWATYWTQPPSSIMPYPALQENSFFHNWLSCGYVPASLRAVNIRCICFSYMLQTRICKLSL